MSGRLRVAETDTPLVGGVSGGQGVGLLPAAGREVLAVAQGVEHLGCPVHPFHLHKHILAPRCHKLSGLERRKRPIHGVDGDGSRGDVGSGGGDSGVDDSYVRLHNEKQWERTFNCVNSFTQFPYCFT